MASDDVLYPECESCGRREGIHKAVVAPADPEGMHDVATLELACGHEQSSDEMQLGEGVVSLFQMHRPEYIEVEQR